MEHHKAHGRIVRDARAAKQGVFTARAVTYGVVDDYGSCWARGVFDESLNTELPIIAFGHDWSKPIGRAQSWRGTPKGPEITARLDNSPDVPLARQVIAQIDSGTLTDAPAGRQD